MIKRGAMPQRKFIGTECTRRTVKDSMRAVSSAFSAASTTPRLRRHVANFAFLEQCCWNAHA
jgi:hypothetical protein